MVNRRDSFLAGLIFVGVFSALAVAEPAADPLSVICTPGYATAHRMSPARAHEIKRSMLGWRHAGDYELDHIVPLCLGGTNDLSNLQLQPWPEAHEKDKLEWKACREVCAGTVSLDVARSWFKRSH